MLQDVYDWAGQDRWIDTGRTGPFCKAAFIIPELDKRFAAIHAEDNLRGIEAETFAMRAAEHISELNAIHPFLDGNGRALRAFLEILAEQAGSAIDLARIDPQAWNAASIAGFHRQDYALMRTYPTLSACTIHLRNFFGSRSKTPCVAACCRRGR
jgi:cell filamentation protein